MAEIKLMIRGVIFALFPHYDKTDQNSEELVRQTTERLDELNRERPAVILMPEPDNPIDPKAIQAWCKGSPLGHVAAEQLQEAHRLFDAGQEMVMARIVDVEVQRKGNICVSAELPTGALLRKNVPPEDENAWKRWKFNLPEFPQPQSWKACRVEEFGIKCIASGTGKVDMEELTRCIQSWTDNSLHDFSREAMQTRLNYIALLSSMGDERLEPYILRLKRQFGAISGGHRMKYRLEWCKELGQSAQMELYWDKWRSGREEDNLYKDLQTIDAHLRRMPDGLYATIGDLELFFSALRYHDVPRDILWNIYTLLLLRERICRNLGIPMKPLPMNAYGVEPDEEVPRFPELTDARLARAIEEHQSFFWGNSTYAVVFCVCRDYFGVPNIVSAFERRIQELTYQKKVRDCPSGTIQKALDNNRFMKTPIGKWEKGRELILANNLKSFLEGVS